MIKKNNQLPDITVVVCTFNHSAWIERCIRSLLNQKFIKKDDFEIILIDDKSTDSTKKILKNFSDLENLRIHSNKKNIGLPKSLNKAIKLSKGRYVTRVDSDDYVNKDFLQILYLQHIEDLVLASYIFYRHRLLLLKIL